MTGTISFIYKKLTSRPTRYAKNKADEVWSERFSAHLPYNISSKYVI
jgi:hypothetical protein